MVGFDFVLDAFDGAEVADGLDAEFERCVAVGYDERPGVVLQRRKRPLGSN